MPIHHQVESGAPFNTDMDLQKNMVVQRGGLRDITASVYRNRAILLEDMYTDPPAVGHMRAGNPDRDGVADQNPRRASAATTLGRDNVFRRAQLQTHHPRSR